MGMDTDTDIGMGMDMGMDVGTDVGTGASLSIPEGCGDGAWMWRDRYPGVVIPGGWDCC